MLLKNNSILFWECNGFPVLYETSFVPFVNKFITPRKKSYDIARHREAFLSQTAQCFNCSFRSKFIYFFVACEIICLYSIWLWELLIHSFHLAWDLIMTINAIIAYSWHLWLGTKFQLVVYKCRISSNNSRGDLFPHQKRAIIRASNWDKLSRCLNNSFGYYFGNTQICFSIYSMFG